MFYYRDKNTWNPINNLNQSRVFQPSSLPLNYRHVDCSRCWGSRSHTHCVLAAGFMRLFAHSDTSSISPYHANHSVWGSVWPCRLCGVRARQCHRRALVKDTQKARVHTGRQAGRQARSLTIILSSLRGSHLPLTPILCVTKITIQKQNKKKKKSRGVVFSDACWLWPVETML